MNLELTLTDITDENRKEKMVKAIHVLSEQLGVPVSVEKKKKPNHRLEPFFYKSQEDLVHKWQHFFSAAVSEVYQFVIDYFDLPEIRVVSKSQVLKYRGKIIYSPETGEPVKQSDWDSFIKLLEKFLNRNIKDCEKKIILSSKALGKILCRMEKTQKIEDVCSLKLKEIKYSGKTFDWISDSVKNMKDVFGESVSRSETARIQVIQQSAAQRVTKVSECLRSDIKQVLLDGVKERKSKSQISSDLFHKMTGHNRDFQRIADTEVQNTMNNAYLLDEVYHAEEGEKVYFKRLEIVDANTCPFCRKMKNVVVLWSNTPLSSDKIDDPVAQYAIWDGKEWDGSKEFVATGVFHPWCRGVWTRYYENEAAELVKQAEKKARETQKSLTWSGYKLSDRYTYAGFNISIENKKGTVRRGTDKDGHEWECRMYFDYGYIRGTKGVDGDHVDVYIGDSENCTNVYIVHQNDPVTEKYDEDKVMLGFSSLQEAKLAYLKQYDRSGFLGKIDIMPVEEFREKVLSKNYKGKMLKSITQQVAELLRI